VSGLFTTINLEFCDPGKLEEEKGFSAGDEDFDVATLMTVELPAVSIGGLETGGEGSAVYRFPGGIIITELDLNIGR